MIVRSGSNFIDLRALTESVACPKVSLHYAAEAVTVLQWSRLSDHIGRKPVLLLGLLGTVVSTVLFGLSRSLWALVLR
jgi:MFS family permease